MTIKGFLLLQGVLSALVQTGVGIDLVDLRSRLMLSFVVMQSVALSEIL